MDIKEALKIIKREYPFKGYIQFEEAYLNIASTVIKWLTPGSRILDFGAGSCDKTAILTLLGYKCTAYDDLQDDWHKIQDNKEKILSFAQKFDIHFEIAKANGFPFRKHEFDMIMMHDILEHLHDSPRDLLNDLLEFLRPAGYLFITVPNAVNIRKRITVILGKSNLPAYECYYWYPGSWRGHIREYVKDDLVKLANYLNLEVLELRSCHHLIKVLPIYLRPLYLVLTGIFTGWRDSWLLVTKKRLDWKTNKILPKDELNRILKQFTTYQYQ